MWLLISERGESFLITPREEHTVGRKGGSITLSDDQSISRVHAKILLQNDDVNTDCGIVLVDISSKYGTYINDGIESSTRITPDEKITLKHDDVIRFGLQWNKWRVVFMPLVILTSTIKQPEKQEVRSQVEKLGGKLVSNWTPQCTHLTMNQITLTVKVVSALGAGQHIVTPKYWQKLLLSIQTKQGMLPDPCDYIPPLNESTLKENEVSFKVNKKRSKLFKSLLFVAVSSKQLACIQPMVTAAGGKVVKFDECSVSKEDFCKEGIILMQDTVYSSPGSGQSQVPKNYSATAKYLESKGLRCIPDSDVGLSIVYCSCEKFCNPRYSAQSLFVRHPVPAEQTESVNVLAQDTEENSPARLSGVGKVINETCVSFVSPSSWKNEKSDCLKVAEENVLSEKRKMRNSDEKMLSEITNHNGGMLPKITENDVLVYNKDNQQNDKPEKSNVSKDNNSCLGNSEDEEFSQLQNKKSKKRMIVSDDEDDNEFRLPSQIKRTRGNFEKEKNSDQNLRSREDKFKKHKNNDMNEALVIDDSDDEDGFSLPSEKKQRSTSGSCLIDTQRDIFDRSNKNDGDNFSKNNKIPTSVDMFGTVRSSSSCRKMSDIENPSTSINSSSKRSVDMFSTTNTFKKSSKMDYDDDCDFKFNDIRQNTKNLDDVLSEDNVFKTPKTVNNDHESEMLSNRTPQGNPFQSNKFSRDMFGQSSSPDTRGIKRSMSIEEPSLKKQCLSKDDLSSDDSNECVDNRPREKSLHRIMIKDEVMEQEPANATIKDPKLHDSTVVVVKSLIVSLKNVSVTNTSNTSKKNSTTNFKKFRKATPLKMPQFIDLVPYKEINTSCWMNETTVADSDVSSDENNDGWTFQQSQAVKQTKKSSKKVK